MRAALSSARAPAPSSGREQRRARLRLGGLGALSRGVWAGVGRERAGDAGNGALGVAGMPIAFGTYLPGICQRLTWEVGLFYV